MIPLAARPSLQSGWRPIRLRRDGMRPLRFTGWLVGRRDGRVPRTILWHDLALYRTTPAGYAVEIVAQLATSADLEQFRPARCHAALFDTLDAALARLETHDASHDVCPAMSAPAQGFCDLTGSPALLAVQAALLRLFCQDVVQRYGAGVGSFLYSICADGI